MTKKERLKIQKKKRSKAAALSLSAINYQLFGLGALILIVGYYFLSKGPADSFWSLTLAPILLVIGYCIVIPLSILYRSKKGTTNQS